MVKDEEIVLNEKETAVRLMENATITYSFIVKEDEADEEPFIFKISKRILGNKKHKSDLEDLKQLYVK